MINFKKQKKQKGFTLIEILVAFAIASIVACFVGEALVHYFRQRRAEYIRRRIRQDMKFAMEYIGAGRADSNQTISGRQCSLRYATNWTALSDAGDSPFFSSKYGGLQANSNVLTLMDSQGDKIAGYYVAKDSSNKERLICVTIIDKKDGSQVQYNHDVVIPCNDIEKPLYDSIKFEISNPFPSEKSRVKMVKIALTITRSNDPPVTASYSELFPVGIGGGTVPR